MRAYHILYFIGFISYLISSVLMLLGVILLFAEIPALATATEQLFVGAIVYGLR